LFVFSKFTAAAVVAVVVYERRDSRSNRSSSGIGGGRRRSNDPFDDPFFSGMGGGFGGASGNYYDERSPDMIAEDSLAWKAAEEVKDMYENSRIHDEWMESHIPRFEARR